MSMSSMRLRAQKWTIVLLILFGVPALLIWVCMPYLDLSRAVYLANQHQYQAAIKTLDRAIAFNAGLETAYVRRGSVHDRLGDSDKALADFNTALRLKADDWEAYNNRAWVEYELSNLEAAFRDADTAVSNCGHCPVALDTRGVILLAQRQYDKALSDFSAAIQLDPTYAQAYYHRARTFGKIGNTEAAAKDLQTASQLGFAAD